uniref:Trace amine-associated receptor 8b-like n=1 Tax=Chinchilla lanigera TaxID=34839 RepID=A0A8C2W4W0_CHILA
MSSNLSQPALQLCYENVNGSCSKTPYSAGCLVMLYAAFVLHFKQLHSPANFLIDPLACADFLVGVTVMPFSMVRSVESCWYFGAKFCTIHSCCDVAFCYSSLFHLCFISMHRHMAVTDPLVCPTKFTVSVSDICIAVSWILPILYSGAVFYTGVNDDGMRSLVSVFNCVGGCQIVVNQTWVLINFLLFFIPTPVMIVLYSKIFWVAKQQAIKIESTRGPSSESSSESHKARVAKRQRKATKTLGIAVVAFNICWLPYTVDTLIDAFMGLITPAYIYEICCWGACYNSAMNPLIYALFYPWLRKVIKLILSGEILKHSSSTAK